MHTLLHRYTLLLALVTLLSFFFDSSAQAQVIVQLKTDKLTYVNDEALKADITIHNRSGKNLILSAPGDRSWLDFEISDARGLNLTPVRGSLALPATVMKAGSTINQSVDLTRHYPMSEFGNYGIIANVYDSGTGQYASSNRIRIAVHKARSFWSQTVGDPNSNARRKYILETYKAPNRSDLYLRVADPVTDLPLVTTSLGTIILVYDPQITIARDNQLHVLFMTGPKIYRHVAMDVQGQIIENGLYREEGIDRPVLVMNKNGDVAIKGGFAYDQKSKPTIRPKKDYQEKRLSDRPSGL